MRTFLKHLLRRSGFELKRLRARPDPIEPWNDDAAFAALYAAVKDHTVVDRKRCFMLAQALRHVLAVPGELAEVGTYRGGTAKLLATVAEPSGKTLHLFDTFAGMPETDPERDIHRKGDFADTSLEAVLNVVGRSPRVIAHPGFFPETAKGMERARFCFAHIDVDIYASVKDGCAFFYPRMERGGLMLFDDYGFLSCPGAKQAVDEFFAATPEKPIYLPTGQCLIIKQ